MASLRPHPAPLRPGRAVFLWALARLALPLLVLPVGCRGTSAPPAPPAGDGGAAPQAAPSLETGIDLLKRGDDKGAEPHLVAALAGAPRDRRILEALGAVYARTDRFQKAEESLRRALAVAPESVSARLGLAAVLIDTGRLDDAEAALAEVRRREPGNLGALVKGALLAARRGRARDAEAGAREAIARQPASAEAHYILGLALIQEGSFGEAAVALRRAQELAPGHLGALSNLVKVEMRLGHTQEALRWRAAHEEALSRGRIEERVRGHRLKGIEAFNREDYRTALQEFLAIAREDPRDPQVHLHLGSTYLALGDLARAQDALQKSLALEPRNERALTEMGRLHATANRLDEAVEALRQAIAINPEFAEPHYYLAGVYLARGEVDLSRQEMRRFEEIRSRAPGAATDLVPATPPGARP